MRNTAHRTSFDVSCRAGLWLIKTKPPTRPEDPDADQGPGATGRLRIGGERISMDPDLRQDRPDVS